MTGYANLIRALLKYHDVKVVDFCKDPRVGLTKKSFYSKLSRDNFSLEQLQTYAEILGCELEIGIVKNGERIV